MGAVRYQVGVQVRDDLAKLNNDYNLKCNGHVDVRNVVLWVDSRFRHDACR